MWTRRQFTSQTAGLGSLAALTNALAMSQQPLQPGVRRIRGDVRINGAPALVDQAVLQGDTIATSAGSEVVYVMGSNAYLMRDNSSVQFIQDGAAGVLRLITGKVLGVFGPGPNALKPRPPPSASGAPPATWRRSMRSPCISASVTVRPIFSPSQMPLKPARSPPRTTTHRST